MNVEEIQDFCLSLGTDVEEKLPERIDELKAQYDCIGNPYEIVKAKYTKKK